MKPKVVSTAPRRIWLQDGNGGGISDMKHLGSLAFIVLLLAISPNLVAQPKRPVLSYSQAPCRPNRTQAAGSQGKAESCESMNRVRQAGARPALSYSQKHALVEAYRAGDHYGIGVILAAIIWQESKLCKIAKTSSAGAMGCAQVKADTAEDVARVRIPDWQLESPGLQDENMAIGARYLELCLQQFGYPAGIGCYYTGRAGAEKLGRRKLVKFWYTRSVLVNMKLLEQLPQEED